MTDPDSDFNASSNSSQHKTSSEQKPFGFEDVDAAEKPGLVQDLFNRVAKSYDVMNDVMSFGVHRLWKNQLIQMMRPRPGMHLLDMAGGTGDVTFRFLEHAQKRPPLGEEPAKVTIGDYSQEMLKEGRRRALNKGILDGIEFVQTDAADLPFDDNTFDAYSISFGLRNVTEIEKALQEAHRVLKPGGVFYCMEFSKVKNDLLKKAYDFYSFQVIPRMGDLIAKDKDAYQYLVESIERFPNQETLAGLLKEAGFQGVTWRNLSDGIVAIHTATKL